MDPVVLSKPRQVRLEVLPPLALYVHIPWCVRKCPYCDFNSHERAGALPEREYVGKLINDLEELLPAVWGRRIVSVFIGGGTPSLFSPESIETLLSGVRARLQLAVEDLLGTAGYGHYETSAFARPGHRCRHNLNYWEFGDYAGIGAGAHGKISFPEHITRHERIKQPKEYLLSKHSMVEDREVPAKEIPFEFMLNALRLVEGFPITLFAERTGFPLAAVEAKLAIAENQNLIERDWKRIRPTERGRHFLNELLQIFLEAAPARSSAAGASF